MKKKKFQNKKSLDIDMTAMVDIAFLLLTFLILTAQPKKPEILPVDLPLAKSITELSKETAIISIGQGKIFFQINNQNIKKRTLERISEKYGVILSENEKSNFIEMEEHGIPLSQLKQVLNLKPSNRLELSQHSGIPSDSINSKPSELYDWIREAHIAANEVNNGKLEFAIKGDANEYYPIAKKVMDILQSQDINSFNLITNLRSSM